MALLVHRSSLDTGERGRRASRRLRPLCRAITRGPKNHDVGSLEMSRYQHHHCNHRPIILSLSSSFKFLALVDAADSFRSRRRFFETDTELKTLNHHQMMAAAKWWLSVKDVKRPEEKPLTELRDQPKTRRRLAAAAHSADINLMYRPSRVNERAHKHTN